MMLPAALLFLAAGGSLSAHPQLPPTTMVAPAYSSAPLDWGAIAADPAARLLLLADSASCPEVDLALALHAGELARAGITHYWFPPGLVGRERRTGRGPAREFLLNGRLRAALDSAGVTALELEFRPEPEGHPDLDGPPTPPEPLGQKTQRFRFTPPKSACASSEFEWSARALAGFLSEHPFARVLALDAPERASGHSLEAPLAWLGVPVRALRVLDDADFLEGLETPRPVGPGLYRPLPRPGAPLTELAVLPELQGRPCLERQAPLPRPAPAAWGCSDRPAMIGRFLELSEPVLRDPSAGAELAHVGRALVELERGGHLCLCEFLGMGDGPGWNPAGGTAERGGRISLSSGTAARDITALATLWHEGQHAYDEAARGAGHSYAIETEERAWRAECAFLSAGTRLGLYQAKEAGRRSCGQDFSVRARSWCELPTAAEQVLAAERGGASARDLRAVCRELERVRGGNPLSLEGFRFSWTEDECLRQARLPAADGSPRSRPDCASWGDPPPLRPGLHVPEK